MIKTLAPYCYRFSHFILRFVVIAFLGYRASGQRNIPATGGALIASNHQSFLDPILLAAGINRPICFLAREGLFTASRIFGIIISLNNAIPIKRDTGSMDIMRRIISLLKEGKLVVIFPEGTRTSDGAIGPFKGGIGLLSRKSATPIIPVNINGAYRIWPRQSALPQRFAKVRVTYTKPVWAREDSAPDEVSDRARAQVAAVR